MSSIGLSITLANSIIGVGILAMPYCFQQCGVLLATLILLLMGLVSRLSCYFLLKSAIISRRRNFEFLAFHVFGYPGKMAVEMGIIGFLMGTCIAYFVVVGDLGPQIIAKVFNINQSDILRTSIMVIVSLVCVLPLGLLRNVDSLSNVSAATIAFYFCLVIKLIVEAMSRLVSEGSLGRVELWRPDGLFQCIPIFSMALFCQTQLFELFEGLPPLTLEKMNVITKNAINICTGVYFTLGLFGYMAFCSQTISGNVLSSLGGAWGSDVIRLGFVMSLAFSFPLVIFPCRASLYSFFYRKVHLMHQDHIINHSIPPGTFRLITVSIIGVSLFISLMMPNIELVLGLVGSTIGVLICVVFPAACFVSVTYKDTNERLLAKVILLLGLMIMILGTIANLESTSNKNEIISLEHQADKIMDDFLKAKKEALKDVNHIIEIRKNRSVNDFINKELQPPNPVPPKTDNQSNGKNEANIETVKSTDTLDLQINVPKNGSIRLNDSIAKKETMRRDSDNNEIKETNDKIPKQIDIPREQQLIETIKKHELEQKELLKEQKEILSEIIQRKKELQLDKKEDEENKAKKIAVESIQKIANIVIDSLSAKSEKTNNGNSDPVDKVGNQAKEEIAQKVEKTLESLSKDRSKAENSDVLIKSKNVYRPGDFNSNLNVITNNSSFKNVSSVRDNNIGKDAVIKSNYIPENIENQNLLTKQKLNNSLPLYPNLGNNINSVQFSNSNLSKIQRQENSKLVKLNNSKYPQVDKLSNFNIDGDIPASFNEKVHIPLVQQSSAQVGSNKILVSESELKNDEKEKNMLK